MKILFELFLLTFLTFSCEYSENKSEWGDTNNNLEGGDCDTDDPYIYEDEGFGVVVEVFSDSIQIGENLNKLYWHYEYPDSTRGNVYYFDSIIDYQNILKPMDTLKLLKIEFGHFKGSCGPQMDSVQFKIIE